MQNTFFVSLSRLSLVVLLAVFMTSCGNFEKISIGDPSEFKLEGFEDNHLKLHIKVPVDNPTHHKIIFSDIDLKVFLNGNYIGKIIMDEGLAIERNVAKEYELPIKIRLANILGAAFIMMNMKQGQKAEIRIEGTITAKSFLVKRTIDIKETKRITL
ncbi:MAG: LEA type 2 family protein [Bacteroidota bacterium]|nr:MAG: LEA type 2 family protein [Bacteroidota bacterium]